MVVPLLGRMSDPHPLARGLAAASFAAVVALMPLAQVAPGLRLGPRVVGQGSLRRVHAEH